MTSESNNWSQISDPYNIAFPSNVSPQEISINQNDTLTIQNSVEEETLDIDNNDYSVKEMKKFKNLVYQIKHSCDSLRMDVFNLTAENHSIKARINELEKDKNLNNRYYYNHNNNTGSTRTQPTAIATRPAIIKRS